MIKTNVQTGTTTFNRETGHVSQGDNKSVWRGNNNHDKEQILIENADVPTRSPEKSKRHRTENKYIEFTPTDKYKDIAQSTGNLMSHQFGFENQFIGIVYSCIYSSIHRYAASRSDTSKTSNWSWHLLQINARVWRVPRSINYTAR